MGRTRGRSGLMKNEMIIMLTALSLLPACTPPAPDASPIRASAHYLMPPYEERAKQVDDPAYWWNGNICMVTKSWDDAPWYTIDEVGNDRACPAPESDDEND